jgi:parvulin-like peptidyl-prolyl isomerase
MLVAAALLLQTSGLVAPLYLQEEVPETRAVRAILVLDSEMPGVPHTIKRTPEEARQLALELTRKIRAGAEFAPLARDLSGHPSARYGGVLGSFWPGMLRGEVDEFLFSAELGEVSDPIPSPIGIQVLQRIDAEAGALQIFVSGTDSAAEERAAKLLLRLRSGEDFATLAREHSDDEPSASRGGQMAVFRRGPEDSLLKAAVFEAPLGEVVGPIRSPLGLHLLKRVPPDEIAPELVDDVIARARAISIAIGPDRKPEEAEALAWKLFHQIQGEGRDMAELARQYDDDPTGRERSGDLGWILRRASRTRGFVDRIFLRPRGELLEPIPMVDGYVLLRRED